jgi:hypothetical protein
MSESNILTAEVGSSWLGMGQLERTTERETHQILSFIINARVLGCIADSLQDCSFTSVGPTDNENTKVVVFRASVEGVEEAGHGT